MKLRYLIVDSNGQLRLVKRTQIETVWEGATCADDLGSTDRSELRLVSVLLDKSLQPQKIYLLRLPLTAGYFTRRNYRTLRTFSMPQRVTAQELFQHHSDGWPPNFFTQLAVALDVARTSLEVPFGIGGPLLMAAALHLPPEKTLRYLK